MLNTVIEQIPLLIAATDADGYISVWNRECERVSGTQADKALGHHYQQNVLFQKVARQVEHAGNSAGASGDQVVTVVVRVPHPDGTLRDIRMHVFRCQQHSDASRQWLVGYGISDQLRLKAVNKTLYWISHAVGSTGNLQALYGSIHKALENIIDVSNFYIALKNRELNRIEFPYFVDEVDEDSPVEDFTKSGSLTAKVLRDGVPQLLTCDDMEAYYQRINRDRVGKPSKIWMGVPLKTKSEPFGVLVTQSYHDPRAFTPADLEMLSSVAEQIALAIEHTAARTALVDSHNELEKRVIERTWWWEKSNRLLYCEMEERLALQERLARTQRLAATGKLAASVAHEINSPLQGIISLLYMARKEVTDNDSLQYKLDLIDEGLERIRHTVQNLLDLNRPGTERKESVQINQVVSGTAALVNVYLRRHQTRLELDLADSLPPVWGASRELGQVFMNLINNAKEAMEGMDSQADREIRIRSGLENGRVLIRIDDSGPGIAPADIDHIFEPFYSRRKIDGMGFGLAICYTIINDHGGTIAANNRPEGGAAFTIALPTAENGEVKLEADGHRR